MKRLFIILLGILSLSAHRKSTQPQDNSAIQKIEITRGFLVMNTEKITLRRGTEVYITRVKGRCRVQGFYDSNTILIEMPDGTVMPFHRNRIRLAPLRK